MTDQDEVEPDLSEHRPVGQVHWQTGAPVVAFAGAVLLLDLSKRVLACSLVWRVRRFFRSWTLSNTLDPLPVELLGFDEACVARQAVLTSATASESNSSHFELERSADGLTFMAIGQVEAAGSSQALLNYRFVDAFPTGQGHYRLRAVDLDGTWRYGPTVVLGCDGTGVLDIATAWDSGDVLNVLITSPLDQYAAIRVLDLGGKLIASTLASLMDGRTLVQMRRENLPSGIYMLRLDAALGTASRRVNVLER